MSQNPNPYESTSYGSNPQGGNNPNYNSPYEQYEPTLPSLGNNPGGYEPTQRASGNNPNANAYPPPPYGQPPAGMGSNPSYPQYAPPQQNNPYQYPHQNPGTPPPPTYTPGQYAPLPQYIPPASPSPGPRRRSSGRLLALIAVAIIVILAGIIAAVAIPLHNAQVSNDNATATAHTQGTAQAGNATAVAQTNATATANANVTATAVASTYPFSANLKLDDPLSDNTKGAGWNTNANCSFSAGAYHAVESSNNTYATCTGIKTNYSDFTYQVTMQIAKGTYGGITFRGDDTNSKNYTFVLGQDGSYILFLYTGATNPKQLKSGTAASFITGNGQNNDIGVVARGSTISLYVNKQPVVSVTDNTYSSGQIGMIVYDTGNAVETIYSNVKVWQL
jgi:hypothetical protein